MGKREKSKMLTLDVREAENLKSIVGHPVNKDHKSRSGMGGNKGMNVGMSEFLSLV